MNLSRRSLFAGAAAFLAAPAIVRAASLMAVKPMLPGVWVHASSTELWASDLTLSIEEFSRRILAPAMEATARAIEEDLWRIDNEMSLTNQHSPLHKG